MRNNCRKIFQINIVANWGSTGRIAEEIGQKVRDNGWNSYIAYGRNAGPSKSHLVKIGDKWDIRLHGLKSRLFDKHGFGSKHATFELIERIKKLSPDIIHLHNIHGYYINIEVLFNYLSIANIPVVWTLHDCWAFTGHCAYFDFAGCNRWKTQCYSCPQKRSYPQSFFTDNSRKNYKDKLRLFNSVKNLTIVPVSNWLEKLVELSFLQNYPQQLIYNGVNLSTFTYQKNIKTMKDKLGVGNRFIILGVASAWGKRKGFDDFINLSKLIDQDSVIVLVGLDKKNKKNLPSNIIGISRTESIKQLAEIYSSADLFINLTYEDNFPTTNLEALACGTPVLTYNTGGSIEAVSIDTGFIVDKGNLSEVINIINTVRKKGKSSYSIACRERAVRLYDKEERYNEYIQLYNKILNRQQ